MKTLTLALLTLALLAATPALAQPTLGPDCGTGATLIGSNTAGKFTVGTDPSWSCTLIFATARNRACNGSVENSSVSIGIEAVGAATTDTTALFASPNGFKPGYVISYQCSPY